MAMRDVVTRLGLRLPGLLQHSVNLAGGVGAPAALTAYRLKHDDGAMNPWGEVLRVARSSPEKLHDIVTTLTDHCIKAQVAPPLQHYNELLRICEQFADLSSVHKLCRMACAVHMHLDHTTFVVLQNAYSYFPKPFTPQPPKSSAEGQHGLGPSTAQHAAARATSAPGGSSSNAAAIGSSSGSSGSTAVRGASILAAPAASSLPSRSTTGGASSVSVGSSGSSSGSSGFSAAASSSSSSSSSSRGLKDPVVAGVGDGAVGQGVRGPSSSSSSSGTSTTATFLRPDAAA